MKLLRRELTKLVAPEAQLRGLGRAARRALAHDAWRSTSTATTATAMTGPAASSPWPATTACFMPIAAITLLSAFLLPLLAAMVGSYQLAGEAETGTIKTWLMHAISRGGVLASKWGVAVIYMAIGLVLVVVGGLVGRRPRLRPARSDAALRPDRRASATASG